MSQVPSDSALLAAAADYLEAQLLPTLEGEHRFKTRLAVNALKALLRGQQELAAQPGQPRDVAQTQNEALALGIFNRSVALDDPQALVRIEELLAQTLRINNPKWLIN